MIILLDMDGVLTDFVGGVCSRYRVKYADLISNWTEGEYCPFEPLNKILDKPITESDFWGDLEHQPNFWRNLDPTPWVQSLMYLAAQYASEWHIVSSPSHCPSSYMGKTDWIKKRFGSRFNNFALTPHKHLFSGRPDRVLIDDCDKNVNKFRQEGGSAILFPCHWNSLYELKGSPAHYVEQQLDNLLGTGYIPD